MARLSVVTGGLGFVGAHLVDGLRARGDEVRVLDIRDQGPRDDVEYRKVDIADPAALAEACAGAETVFHNASLVHTKHNRESDVWRVNLTGTENVIAACRRQGTGRLVYVSSASVVYDGKDIQNGDETLPYAKSIQAPYAASKIAAEKQVLAANDASLATVSLRPHVIFGPGDRRLLPALLAHARAGRLRFQVGRGTWLSDYTYATNLIDALLLADEGLAPGAPISGQAYFITNGEPMAFWGFVQRVLARLGFPPIRYRLPHQLVYGIAAIKEGIDTLRGGTLDAEDGLTRFAIRYMCTHHYFSIERARRELGYDPKVSVDEGIELTCRNLEATGAA